MSVRCKYQCFNFIKYIKLKRQTKLNKNKYKMLHLFFILFHLHKIKFAFNIFKNKTVRDVARCVECI